jgi:predicted RNA methylase
MERPDRKEECMILDECSGMSLHLEHVARYHLAAPFAARKRVLDDATGLGHGAVTLAQAGAAEVAGIDTDRQAIQDTARRYTLPNVRFRVDDMTRLDTVLEASHEDSDWSITARRAGHALGNAPLATVIHQHLEFYQTEQRDAHDGSQRYDKGKLERTLIRFHEKHGLFIDEEDLYPYLGYPNSEAFIERALAGRGGRA